MPRLSPRIKISLVNTLGGLTLAGIAGYFFALARTLLTEDAQWGEFFASNVLWFLYVPFTLGLVYFFARVQLSRSLLAQGALDEVVAWTTPRLRYNFWMRGKREVLIQRVVLAQAYLRQVEYEKAREVLWLDEPLPARARELIELYVWRVTWALRQEDLVRARQASEQGEAFKKPVEYRAELLALDASRALRAGNYEDVRRLLEESRWLAPTWQADWTRALWASQDPGARDMQAEVLGRHDGLVSQLRTVLPGALPEYLVSIAAVMSHNDESMRADDLRDEARALVREGQADPRSVWVVNQSMTGDEEE